MNERIRELAEQARVDGDAIHYYSPLFAEKFAELIVRQCIYLVENLPPGYKDYRNQIEDSFRTDCVEKIEQYFGVKK